MRINSLTIENFKGIATKTTIEVRPLTIFVGANSSGKSTCLHALAALCQSLKLPNNSSAITLDDDFAYVHLGRFIDAMHTTSYDDSIRLGLTLDRVGLPIPEEKEGKTTFGVQTHSLSASYTFKCTRRTQDVTVDAARYEFGKHWFEVRRAGKKHNLHTSVAKESWPMARRPAFLFEIDPAVFLNRQQRLFGYQYLPFQATQEALAAAIRNVRYLGPFRWPPRRRYPSYGTAPYEVGPQGESTIPMLANETIRSRKRQHIEQVSKWLTDLSIGASVDTSRIGQSDLFEMSVKLADGAAFPLADLGFGVSQALPVLAQCSFATDGCTLLFEQPEIHLHPLAAERLASVFVDTVKRGITVMAETHSPGLVKRLQDELRSKRIKPDDIAVYRVWRENGSTKLKLVEFEADGDVDELWERNFSREH
jgi:AAA domain, putative AbiEii toxin, Type IV TA system